MRREFIRCGVFGVGLRARRGSENAPERATTRGKGLGRMPGWRSYPTREGAAYPSCQCNLDLPLPKEGTSLARPLLAGRPASRVADRPVAQLVLLGALVQPANWSSGHRVILSILLCSTNSAPSQLPQAAPYMYLPPISSSVAGDRFGCASQTLA
jgi:hypothetical protein